MSEENRYRAAASPNESWPNRMMHRSGNKRNSKTHLPVEESIALHVGLDRRDRLEPLDVRLQVRVVIEQRRLEAHKRLEGVPCLQESRVTASESTHISWGNGASWG